MQKRVGRRAYPLFQAIGLRDRFQSTFFASADSSLNPFRLLNASSFCLSASLGLAICSMEVMPASFIFFAVAGPIPFTRVRSDLSAGLAAFFGAAAFGLAVLAFLAAGLAAVVFFAGAAFLVPLAFLVDALGLEADLPLSLDAIPRRSNNADCSSWNSFMRRSNSSLKRFISRSRSSSMSLRSLRTGS